MSDLTVYFDGSCGPSNPGGTAAYGFVVKKNGTTIGQGHGRSVSGKLASNNVGEADGLYHAMLYVHEHHPEASVVFYGDSTLIINLINKVAKAKKGLYLPYYLKAAELAEPYIEKRQWSFEYIPREMNSEADELAQYFRFKPKEDRCLRLTE